MIREKRRKKTRTKKFFLGLVCIVAVLVVATIIVLNVFVVKTVKVSGNVLYDEALIKETVLNDRYSGNSLYVFLKYTFTNTEEIPFIDTMEITLEDPNTLNIKVYEKGMMGYLDIESIGQMAYFDKDGFVVETSTRVIENVPKIDGIKCDEVVLYEKLPIKSADLKKILTLTQALKREGLEPESVLYGVDDSPVLCYGDVIVKLGSMELLTQKIERLNEMLPKLSGMSGTLHLENWTEENINVVFEKIQKEDETDETDTTNTEEDTDFPVPFTLT